MRDKDWVPFLKAQKRFTQQIIKDYMNKIEIDGFLKYIFERMFTRGISTTKGHVGYLPKLVAGKIIVRSVVEYTLEETRIFGEGNRQKTWYLLDKVMEINGICIHRRIILKEISKNNFIFLYPIIFQ